MEGERRLTAPEEGKSEQTARRNDHKNGTDEDGLVFAVDSVDGPHDVRNQKNEECYRRKSLDIMCAPSGCHLRVERNTVENGICFRDIINGVMMFGRRCFLFSKKVQHIEGSIPDGRVRC